MTDFDRRELLKWAGMLGIPLVGTVCGLGGAGSSVRVLRRSSPDRCQEGLALLQTCPVAGFQFYDGERVWSRLRIGALLELRREAGNPHDDRAVEVWWEQYKLGYLPRRDNAVASQWLDRGIPLHVRLFRRRQSRDPWRRLELAILFDPTTIIVGTGWLRDGFPGPERVVSSRGETQCTRRLYERLPGSSGPG